MFDWPLFADDIGIPIDNDAEAKVSYKLCVYTYNIHLLMFMFDWPLFADDMGIPIDIDAEAKVSYKLCGYA